MGDEDRIPAARRGTLQVIIERGQIRIDRCGRLRTERHFVAVGRLRIPEDHDRGVASKVSSTEARGLAPPKGLVVQGQEERPVAQTREDMCVRGGSCNQACDFLFLETFGPGLLRNLVAPNEVEWACQKHLFGQEPLEETPQRRQLPVDVGLGALLPFDQVVAIVDREGSVEGLKVCEGQDPGVLQEVLDGLGVRPPGGLGPLFGQEIVEELWQFCENPLSYTDTPAHHHRPH